MRPNAVVVNAAVRIVGDDFYAVHMSWGAVNELATLRFYGLIRQRTKHHVLRQVLGDLMRQEAQHFAFYYTNAIERLEGNPRGQRLVRWVMTHLWTPVGVGLRDRDDVDRITESLFVDEPGVVAQIDSTISRIPGLKGSTSCAAQSTPSKCVRSSSQRTRRRW